MGFIVNSFEKGVSAFMSTTLSDSAAHIAVITAMGAVNGLQRFGNNQVTSVTNAYILQLKNSAVGANISDYMNKAVETLMEPNIEGIVIHTDTSTVTRDVDISESVTIVQEGYQKEYNIDNAVPHLRQWTLTGYMTSILSFGLDTLFTIKPTLIMQQNYLDAVAASRQPVWFKTSNCEFVLVQISHLEMSQSPDATNAIKISISLVEYKPLTMSNKTINIAQMKAVLSEASAS